MNRSTLYGLLLAGGIIVAGVGMALYALLGSVSSAPESSLQETTRGSSRTARDTYSSQQSRSGFTSSSHSKVSPDDSGRGGGSNSPLQKPDFSRIREQPIRPDLSKESTEELIARYKNPATSHDLKRDVLYALGKRQEREADEFIREVALSDSDPTLRIAALESMVERADAFSVELREQAIKEDPSPEVRSGAILSLALDKENRNKEKVYELYQGQWGTEGQIDVKKVWIVALALVKHGNAEETFMNILTDATQTMELRRSAAGSLEGFITDKDLPRLEALQQSYQQNEETGELADVLHYLILKTKAKETIRAE